METTVFRIIAIIIGLFFVYNLIKTDRNRVRVNKWIKYIFVVLLVLIILPYIFPRLSILFERSIYILVIFIVFGVIYDQLNPTTISMWGDDSQW